MPDRTWDGDMRDTFDRRVHQYLEGLRDLPGAKPLIPTCKGGKKLLMPEAGIKPASCTALGPK